MINNGVPAGNTTAAAHAFYNYMWGQYLGSIPAPRTNILWSGPIYILLFVVLLTLLAYAYARFNNHAHRTHGEMYGIMSFAGSILERIGPIPLADLTLWVILILWVLNYMFNQVMGGYLYAVPVH